jgi:hypothetical protein
MTYVCTCVCLTYHERLEIGSPPLSQAISDLPFIIDAMRRVELLGLFWRGEPVVEPGFETVNLVFTGFEVVAGSSGRVSLARELHEYEEIPKQDRKSAKERRKRGLSMTYNLKKALAI